MDSVTTSGIESGGTEPAPVLQRAPGPRHVRAGFIPLVDASVLIVAAELGFARREGIELDLVKDVSWSNIRDRLTFRQFDVAHMLSPMPVAAALGIGSNPHPLIAPMSLGLGGNAITLSVALYRQMQRSAGLSGTESAMENAFALRKVVEERRANGEPMLTFAMTYPFSSHNYEFRYWMGAAGIHPDQDVRMVVVPPPLTADALAAGAIDGFCVGAPWNMLGVEAGVGRIVATKADLWAASPEKVIGMRPEWAEANLETVHRLIVALDAAARWCDTPGNRDALAEILARPAYIGAPLSILKRLLTGEFMVDPSGVSRSVPDYFVFHHGAANFPWRSQALWIYSQMVRWGQVRFDERFVDLSASAFRPDIYREALAGTDTAMPVADSRIEGASDGPLVVPSLGGSALTVGADRFCDGRVFRPDAIEAYIDGFEISTPLRHSFEDGTV
ncbi:CmpA/NrtA family ABC transporter substrate-binding protein [Methylobrevis pamukkalensis]|uniref:Nitrate transport protein NrtA n=1 Tax=Methylobrevis pamukkalensis TaxID=1439726 RepID=A0A1E3H4A9_9HYPH|nr:CmpA/NrtA family ABC transporter substrate-binding protein [Methylobrevis pamukkalensis]ODN70606.1 Nitrate transport protein NrtA precursor [Methylobrevis pamukkalensis]